MTINKQEDYFKEKRSIVDIKTEVLHQFITEWSAVVSTQTPAIVVDMMAGQGFAENEISFPAFDLISSKLPGSMLASSSEMNLQFFWGDGAANFLHKAKMVFEGLELMGEKLEMPFLLDTDENKELLLSKLNQQQNPNLVFTDPFLYPFARQVFVQSLEAEKTDMFLLLNPVKFKTMLSEPIDLNYLQDLFGEAWEGTFAALQSENNQRKRQSLLLKKFSQMLEEKGFYPISLAVDLPDKVQTYQYLLLASKNKATYFLMKEFIQQYSEKQDDGVPLFSVNQEIEQPSIPGFYKSLNKYCIENLAEELIQEKKQYHYQTLQEIFEMHSPGTNYIKANYIAAFKRLRKQGLVSIVDEQNIQQRTVTDASIIFYKLHSSKSKAS